MNTPPHGARPRVLLVDDDASIRRLAELALEELPIDLVCCASAAEARAALAAAPAALLITDMMMPGESGLDLVTALAADPALRGEARLAVFSAGLNAAMRARLAALGVWRCLDKPVPLQVLEACVLDALAPAAGVVEAGQEGSPEVPHEVLASATADGPSEASSDAPSAAGLDAGARQAVEHGFAGDLALYLAFREQARLQFHDDLRELARSHAAHDAQALRRQAHSLKGVLAILGEAEGEALARALEHAAADGDAARCERLVPVLAAFVGRLAAPAG